MAGSSSANPRCLRSLANNCFLLSKCPSSLILSAVVERGNAWLSNSFPFQKKAFGWHLGLVGSCLFLESGTNSHLSVASARLVAGVTWGVTVQTNKQTNVTQVSFEKLKILILILTNQNMQTVLRVIRYLCLHAAFETIYFIKWLKCA